MTQLQGLGHVRLVGETKVQDHPEEAFAIGIHLEPALGRHPWNVLIDHRQQHHLVMQHLVVQQVMQQGMGHGVRAGGKEHRGTLDPVRWLHADAADEDRQWQAAFVQAVHQQLLAALPGGHQDEQHDPRQYREGTALDDLRHVGGEEQPIHQEETQQHWQG